MDDSPSGALDHTSNQGSSTPGCLLFSAAQDSYSCQGEIWPATSCVLFFVFLFLNGFPNVKHKVNYVIRNTQAHRKLTQL